MKKRIIYGVVQLLVISILLLLAFGLGRSTALNEQQSVGYRKNSIVLVDTILGRKYIVFLLRLYILVSSGATLMS